MTSNTRVSQNIYTESEFLSVLCLKLPFCLKKTNREQKKKIWKVLTISECEFEREMNFACYFLENYYIVVKEGRREI